MDIGRRRASDWVIEIANTQGFARYFVPPALRDNEVTSNVRLSRTPNGV